MYVVLSARRLSIQKLMAWNTDINITTLFKQVQLYIFQDDISFHCGTFHKGRG